LAPDKTLNGRPYLELNLPPFGGHPREIFKPVIIHSAYSFVMVHNHPSGDPNPSEADLRLTRRTVEAGRILQLQLIDHVIIGAPAPKRNSYFSFKGAGFIG
jgi:DNA repair protein RadC